MKRPLSLVLLPLILATTLTTSTVGGSVLTDWNIDHGDHSHTDVHTDPDLAKGKCSEGSVCVPVSYSSISCSAWSNIRATSEVRAIFDVLKCGYLHDEPMVCVPSEHVTREQQCNINDDKIQTSNYNITIDEAISALAGSLTEKGTPWNTASTQQCGTPFYDDTKLSGGEDSYPGEWPWMAALMYKRLNQASPELRNLCGGSLVSRRVVLTAAHCVTRTDEYELEAVRLGDNDLTSLFDCKDPFLKGSICYCSQDCPGHRTEVKCLVAGNCAAPHQVYKVAKVVTHPDFRKAGKLLLKDFGLVFLDKDVIITDNIKPACLPNIHFQEDLVLFRIVTGWGNVNGEVGGYIPANILQKLTVSLVPMEECGKIWFEDTTKVGSELLCARSAGQTVGESVCSGDSGGPLVYTTNGRNYVQYGVVSFGSPTCGDPKPTFYAVLSPDIVQWIEEQVGKENLPQNP